MDIANRLLGQVAPDEFAVLRPHLEGVSLAHGQALIAPNEPIRYMYFPISALASLVTILEDGATVESGSVGREGMVGVPVLLNAETTPMQTVVQIEGESYRIESGVVKRVYDMGKTLHSIMNRYIHTLFVVASQSAACNRRHQVEARLSRWLLMSSDGIGSNEVGITQEYLAAMLGVRRPGVTEAAVKLQDEGLIRYSRGHVQITNREGLEDRACECYATVREEYAQLFR
jgi:CRP-like cAMP-binding protein